MNSPISIIRVIMASTRSTAPFAGPEPVDPHIACFPFVLFSPLSRLTPSHVTPPQTHKYHPPVPFPCDPTGNGTFWNIFPLPSIPWQ